MINEQEFNIANKSYTNKDFASIYPELLELAKKLTNKWDPSTSNESDPGVVLLKLLAFIGDKNNYNIDKNVLEAFMPSATQESSMRKLSEMNGYEMNYYNSATVNVTFMYKGQMSNTSGSEKMSIILPAYSTVITGSESSVTYVLTDRVDLTTRGISITRPAIEGTLKTLRGTDNSFIQLNNLDDNNRLYFPERFIAINGIFITNISETNNLWDRVDNLNTEIPSVKCFKFGFDSTKNLPYIEFSKYIATLIGDGLDIKYVVTQGAAGNVKANFLNRLYNTTDLSSFTTWSSAEAKSHLPVSLENLVISNFSASLNGTNPESIDDAYNNFKRVVGTFQTLVTCRDYANFIYRLLDNNNNSDVSNIQVADRRTDINYSNNILTFGPFGQHVLSNEDKTKITPFDLCLYPLNSTNSNYDAASYYNSFKRKVIFADYLEKNKLIEAVKSISHDLKELDSDDVYLYKNYCTLNVRITTTAKVTTVEADSIITNVKNALYKKFNAREVDYGYEIPYDSIFNAIQQADVRIKNISLDEPVLTTKVMKNDINLSEIDYNYVDSNQSEHEKLLAKNILAGRISLFDYYDDFSFDFYQSAVTGITPVIERLSKMTTEVTIPYASIVAGYTLKENEVIQLIGPNLTTKVTYPQYINFNYVGEEVQPGAEYQLQSGETLKINYTGTNDVVRNITYGEGDIIRTNFLLQATSLNTRTRIEKTVSGNPLWMNTLTINETIEIREFVKSTLKPTIWKCYWLLDERKNPDNCLFSTGQTDRLLTEGESFLYTDDAMNELVILGSGTKLSIVTGPTSDSVWTLDRTKLISKEKITDEGLAAFSSFDWQPVDFSTNKLTIQEMQIYTFGEGSTVKISGIATDFTNTQQEISETATIQYKNADSDSYETVPQYSIIGENWYANSRLDINMGPTQIQKIDENQTITLTYVDESEVEQSQPIVITKESGKNTVMSLNTQIQRSGGVDIDLRVSTFENQQIEKTYDVSAFVYNQNVVDENLTRDADSGLVVYEVKNYKSPLNLRLITLDDKTTLVLFYWNKPEDSAVTKIEITADGTGTVSVSKYNQEESDGDLVAGLNILQVNGTVSSLTVTITGATTSVSDTLLIGKISVVNDINHDRFGFDLTNKDALTASLLERIKTLATVAGNDVFYYNAPLDVSHLIEVDDLSLPQALFDYNNIANQFTLEEIDVDGSSIDIARASRI